MSYSPRVFSTGTGNDVFDERRARGVREARSLLESAIDELEIRGDNVRDDPEAEPSARTRREDIFIVHGHNTGRKEEVARLVERLVGRTPVILHEKPDLNRTIIEKFETHAFDARLVLVLLTADDEGGPRNCPAQLRARQNVIFEMGFFLGALGREAVIILYEDGVELPSDVQGILYIRLDIDGAWRTKLANEMRARGFDDLDYGVL